MSDSIRVTVPPDRFQVNTGEAIQVPIDVQNASRVVDVYSVEVLGLDAAWCQLAQSSLSLFPGDKNTDTLTISPPRGSDSTAKTYDFTVKVTSETFPDEETSVDGILAVEPFYSFALDLHPERVTGVVGRYTLSFRNDGNDALTFALEGEDPQGFCRFSFDPDPPIVPPGGRLDAAVTVVTRRRPIFGLPRTYNLTLTATPDKTPEVTTINARFDALPRIRKWYIPAFLGAVLLALVMVYSVYWLAALQGRWTYFGGETWDEPVAVPPAVKGKIAQGPVAHGTVYAYPLQRAEDSANAADPASARANDAPELGSQTSIRAGASWAAGDDTPTSISMILKNPDGKCSRARQVVQGGSPIEFADFQPCNGVPFGNVLINRTTGNTPGPSTYQGVAQPLVKYCAVTSLESVGAVSRVKYQDDGAPQVDVSYSPPGPGWVIYIVNPFTVDEFQEPLQGLTVRLKAAEKGTGGPGFLRAITFGKLFQGPRRDLSNPIAIALPDEIPESGASARCGTDWDNLATDGSVALLEDSGLVHGFIYVRQILGCQAPVGQAPESWSRACVPNSTGLEGITQMLVDVSWARENDDGARTPQSITMILRDPYNNCWITSQDQRVAEDEETIVYFPQPSSGLTPAPQPAEVQFQPQDERPSCQEILTNPKQNLWNLVNWTSFTPAVYQGVAPLVTMCSLNNDPNRQNAWFTESGAIPRLDDQSWGDDGTPGWNLYLINSNSTAATPEDLRVYIRGDDQWKLGLSRYDPADFRGPPFAATANCPSP